MVDGLPGRRAQLEILRQVADGARAVRVRLGRDLLEQPKLAGKLIAM